MKLRLAVTVVGAVLVAVALVGTLAVEGQQAGKVYRIGILAVSRTPHLVEALRQGWRERGYMEGKNLVLEWRFSEGRNERYADFAAEFVRLKVDVMVTLTNPGAQAAKDATNTIPIVMGSSASPDRTGLVSSLARPGGNVTGLSIDTGPEIAAKMLQLLKEAVPQVSRVAVLHGVGSPVWAEQSGTLLREINAAAHRLGLTLQPAPVRDASEFARAFAAVANARAEALLVEPGALAFVHRRLIVEFAAKQQVPGLYPFREFVEDGGLMAYGVDLKDLYRRAGAYVDKILKGAKPADLPIEQPTKFELVINMKTAKALGLTIPQSVLLRADEVIQ